MSEQKKVVLSDRVTIYNADCHDMLKLLNQVDAVVSDPPYGMNWNTDSRRFTGGATPKKRGRGLARKKIEGDEQPFDPSPWLEKEHVVLWGSNHYAQKLPVGTSLVWLKRYDHAFGKFLSDAEMGWMKGGHGVYCHRDCSMNGAGVNFESLHPTQKPVPLMGWCMDLAKIPESATVLDPYMGSGSTGIAAIRTGRNFIGIEIDSDYFEKAKERLKKELDNGDLFHHITSEPE